MIYIFKKYIYWYKFKVKRSSIFSVMHAGFSHLYIVKLVAHPKPQLFVFLL